MCPTDEQLTREDSKRYARVAPATTRDSNPSPGCPPPSGGAKYRRREGVQSRNRLRPPAPLDLHPSRQPQTRTKRRRGSPKPPPPACDRDAAHHPGRSKEPPVIRESGDGLIPKRSPRNC